MKNISIIVAIADNNAIGKNNDLLWHISDDLKRFKKITTDRTIIMGKNTYLSLPLRPLPNRRSVVITDLPDEKFDGCVMAYSIDEALKLADLENENFIIGGAMIYKQFLELADKLYLTRVRHDFEADVFFPKINFEEWELIESENFDAGQKCEFKIAYEIYSRK